MSPQTLEGGFSSPATDAAFAFRGLMTAMARPGQIQNVAGGAGPRPLSIAAATVLLTLCDTTTPLHLTGPYDTMSIRAWIGFHTGAPISTADKAQFALGQWSDLLPLNQYSKGTPDYPDRSATLIVELHSIDANGATLRGPGIENEALFSLPERAAFQENAKLFPLGLDFIFTSGNRLAALPRTTEVS